MSKQANMLSPISAVRLIVPDERGRVLILKRAATAGCGADAWCLPGGKIDYGEIAEAAVVRELCEETALQCEHARFLFYQDSLPPAPAAMHCLNLYFECRASGRLALNAESSAAAWIGPAEINAQRIVFGNRDGLLRYWSERRSEAAVAS